MFTLMAIKSQEFNSGETVEPGDYLDMDTGAVVHVRERDELPEGSRVVRYTRRFRRVEPAEDRTELILR